MHPCQESGPYWVLGRALSKCVLPACQSPQIGTLQDKAVLQAVVYTTECSCWLAWADLKVVFKYIHMLSIPILLHVHYSSIAGAFLALHTLCSCSVKRVNNLNVFCSLWLCSSELVLSTHAPNQSIHMYAWAGVFDGILLIESSGEQMIEFASWSLQILKIEQVRQHRTAKTISEVLQDIPFEKCWPLEAIMTTMRSTEGGGKLVQILQS